MSVEEEASPGVPEWVVTYGDMMSLLLTFFIMLVSMSEMRSDGRLRAMMDALKEKFGKTPVMAAGVPGPSLQKTSSNHELASSGRRSEGGLEIASHNSPGISGAYTPVEKIRDGHRVTLGGTSMFPKESAELSEELRTNLDRMHEVLAPMSQQIVIRGHTSPAPLPADSPYSSHVELSFARALAVARYFEQRGIEWDRIQISAAGAFEPRIRTRDQDRQRENDRVDVFLSDSYTSSP